MANPIVIPAPDLDRAVYVAVAGARNDAEADILAGVAQRIVVQNPNISTAQLRDAVTELRDAIAANRPTRQADLARDSALLMSRLLTRVVPGLTSPILRTAAREFTRAFFNSYRRGTSALRQVAPIDLQFDRFGDVERFRRETWQQLHDQARATPAVAEAINTGPIAEMLGVLTSQDAATTLARVELEPFTTFVADRVQPGGGILVTREDIDATLAGVSSTVNILINNYAGNVVVINTAQQATDGVPTSEFERLIREAEKKLQGLDEILNTATKGVNGTFGVLAFVAGQFGESDLATDINEYALVLTKMLDATRSFADDCLSIAKAIQGLDGVTADQILLGAGIGFNVAMIAVVIQMSGLFGRSKPPEQIILEQLREIRKQIVDLRDEMRVRFDRIEKRLNAVYVGILNRLAEMDFDLGQIEGKLDDLQLALYELHSELQRLNRNVYAFLEAAHRRELVEAINGFLRFRQRTGEDLSRDDFRDAENKFFSWGNDYAKDILQAGPEDRSFVDADLLGEVTALPLATNINYLRRFPAERFNLAPLSPIRLANPFDWIVAGEAYAQLHEESPAQTPSPDRVQALIVVGEALGASLSRIADESLFESLAAHYRAAFAELQAAIAGFELEFRADPDTQLQGIDLFGGVDQEPMTHPLDVNFIELRRCDGRNFDESHDTVPVPINIGSGFDYAVLQPYMIASNLSSSKIADVAADLAELSACVVARWEVQESAPAGFGGRVRVIYRLMIDVNIRYGAAVIFTHSYRSTESLQQLLSKDEFESGTFYPTKNPYPLFFGDTNLWAKLETFPVTVGLVNPALRDATVALLMRKLVILQRAFYARVVERSASAGDRIQRAVRVLDGSKLLWQAFVTAGLPLRIEANEILRSLLFGSDAILGGSDAVGDDLLLDDVQDLYSYFSGREEDPPPANIAGDIEALAMDRVGRLSALLAEIVAAIKVSGEPEPPELFAPTLLRLRLIGAP